MSSVARDIAARQLASREVLPANPVTWGRSFGLTPAEAMRLLDAEKQRRS